MILYQSSPAMPLAFTAQLNSSLLLLLKDAYVQIDQTIEYLTKKGNLTALDVTVKQTYLLHNSENTFFYTSRNLKFHKGIIKKLSG